MRITQYPMASHRSDKVLWRPKTPGWYRYVIMIILLLMVGIIIAPFFRA